jgi:heat shock protein HslJ
MLSIASDRSVVRSVLATVVVAALVSGCAGRSAGPAGRVLSADAIIGKRWLWEATVSAHETIAVPNPENYTLELMPSGTAAVRFDCNRGAGSYKIAAGQLSFGPMMSSRMACPPGSLDSRYARDLRRVIAFFVEDGKLYLEQPPGYGTLRFAPAE